MRNIAIYALCTIFSTCAIADSIKVGDVEHRGVYVGADKDNYYIHFPEEGRMEKVSRKRKDVQPPKIDTDATVRTALMERFEEMKEKAERQKTSTVRGMQLTSEEFKEIRRNKSIALFDAQLEHWTDLSPTERRLVQKNLSGHAEGNVQSYAISKDAVEGQIGDLESEKSDHLARLSELEQGKQSAIDEAERDNASDIFMEEYQKSLLERQMGRGSSFDEHWREAAEVEDAYATTRKNAAEQSFERGAAPHEKAVSTIDSAIVQKERDAIAVENKAIDGEKRIAAFESRVSELTNAINMAYRSELKPVVSASWSDSSSKKTAPFAIDAPFWRLDCLRDDFGQAGKFSVTVYDADTDQPFTQIADVDYLQMRVRVLDGPGRYYLKIEQDESALPYEIRVVTFAK
jgi:hypothetical protein